MLELNPITVDSSELIAQTFNFWFNDNEHIRSPFPNYIHHELRTVSTEKFYQWASGLNPKAKDEVNDEIIAEKFEEIIFEAATHLVMTDDEKMTIEYPFLPRLNDTIFEDVENKTGESTIVDRSIVKEDDHTFMRIKLEKTDTLEKWETKFELPK